MTVFGVLRQVTADAPPARSTVWLRRSAAFAVHYRVVLTPVVALLVLFTVPALTTKGVVVADLLAVALVAVGVEAALALRFAEHDVTARAARLDEAVATLRARVAAGIAALADELSRVAGADVRVAVHVSDAAAGTDTQLVRDAWRGGAARRSADTDGHGAVAVRIDAPAGTVGVVVVDGFAPDAALRRLRSSAAWQRLAALLEAGALPV